jgi:hypothetical protein
VRCPCSTSCRRTRRSPGNVALVQRAVEILQAPSALPTSIDQAALASDVVAALAQGRQDARGGRCLP